MAALVSTGPFLAPIAPSPADGQVLCEARKMLQSSSHYFLRTVQCEFDGGVLTVRGRVPTFYLKQLAQALLARVPGVDRLVNRLDVCNPAGV
jgi:hypothetical protein